MRSRDPDRAACPACGGELAAWLSVPASEPSRAGERFALWRCVSCGSAVTAGEPEPELHDSGAYRPGVPRLHRAALPLLRVFDDQRLALLRTLAPPGARVLDVGAGQGRFVARARAGGYDAAGIEPAGRGLQRAAILGAPVTQSTIEQAEIAPGSLDAVTLWHVLEHLVDPGAALERIASWCKPGGGLLVGVPNLASLQAQIAGAHWYHLDVPRHRTHFTPAGLRTLLDASGFRVVGARHTLLEHNPYGMWQSVLNLVTEHPSYLFNLLKRNAPLRSWDLALTALALPLAPLAALAELAAGLTGRGGTVAVLARRHG
ncbi:MAG: class I SAM-dependent methyltransferase [Solirubrobacteraceae bacterium]